MTTDLIQIRCSKCRQKFDRQGVRSRRICDRCLSPGMATKRALLDRKRLTRENLGYGPQAHTAIPDRQKPPTFPQVTPIAETPCRASKTWHRVIREMERAKAQPGLEGYARNLAHLAEDVALNDAWSREDQLRAFGAVIA